MIRDRTVIGLRNLAASLGVTAEGSKWYLFGSVDRDEADARDIDLLILCMGHSQADALRKAIDPDYLELPLHLAFMTFEEESEVAAVRMQKGRAIFP
ncbi:MAG: hypothetical protein QM740_16600 [Acidovorax sp.]